MIAQLARTFALALLAVLSACSSPLVGAECRQGLSRCDGQCVDVERDPEHCGSCANDCGRLECRNARCGPGLRPDEDGGSFVADGGGGPPISHGGVGTPFTPDGGLNFPDPLVNGCSIGETVCDDKCTNPSSNTDHCGGCGQPCDAGRVCGGGRCVEPCVGVQTMCGVSCVPPNPDSDTSPNLCGPCAVTCASGICGEGACDDAVPGHLVIIGHDYSALLETSVTMKRLAGNALSLARGAPVRALVYRGTASEESVEGVEAAIDFAIKLDGRTWSRTDADEREVAFQLSAADAFIMYAQADMTDAKLIELGRWWGRALAQFLQRGGVILLFETPTAANAGTYGLLKPIGVFRAARRAAVPAQTLTVVSPGVGVAARATVKYRSAANTVRFLDVTTPGGPVVEDGDGETVIFHRIVSP